jgi:hypothetical protein
VDARTRRLTLSDALDLVGVNDFQHGKRVAMIARETALVLGLPEQRLDRIVCAGLLHDLGVSSTAVHRRLLRQTDWDDRRAHCETGYRLLRPFAHLSLVANAVRYHHTAWHELPAGLERVGCARQQPDPARRPRGRHAVAARSSTTRWFIRMLASVDAITALADQCPVAGSRAGLSRRGSSARGVLDRAGTAPCQCATW